MNSHSHKKISEDAGWVWMWIEQGYFSGAKQAPATVWHMVPHRGEKIVFVLPNPTSGPVAGWFSWWSTGIKMVWHQILSGQVGKRANIKVCPNLSESNTTTVHPPWENSFSVGIASHSTVHWLPHRMAGIACPLTLAESSPWLSCSSRTVKPGPASFGWPQCITFTVHEIMLVSHKFCLCFFKKWHCFFAVPIKFFFSCAKTLTIESSDSSQKWSNVCASFSHQFCANQLLPPSSLWKTKSSIQSTHSLVKSFVGGCSNLGDELSVRSHPTFC